MKMKRAITALSILCGGLLFVNPVANIFAQGTNTNQVIEQAQTTENSTNKEITNQPIVKANETVAKEQKEEVKSKNIETNNNVVNKVNKIETTQKQENVKDEVKIDKVEKEEPKEENKDVVKEENNTQVKDEQQDVEKEQVTTEEPKKEEPKDESNVEVINVLNKEQAQEVLKMYKKDVQFTYEGDENNFQALSQRGLSGYVFFPDYDTDLGFFVDKNTASIYYFHPSGYLELAL
ncbi:hypothetical protein [Romboutsia lituseburensis]|uniref:Uncharacterized protein n=2 Tax=Romboutsia lituseburensis TaxID=1537 RepID=A0A1G9P806_9FIRM|nr:hypothetical protein [Romboutsia lituseburensis]CEH33277.1 Hypothetical protein RLITU_0671 [Romboutsia lituseburensis]SDL94834.1 hypothetical protein SAMN04515677_104251 [Romboutsia lituseburensis DSM 797]